MNRLSAPHLTAALVALWLASACHTIELAAPANPKVETPRSQTSASIVVEPSSRTLSYSFGGTSAGLANRFEVEVGETLMRYAEAYCARAFQSGSELQLEVEIESFTIAEGAGQLVTRFTVRRDGETIFAPHYMVEGPPRPELPGSTGLTTGAGVAAEGSTSVLRESLRRTLHDVLTLTLWTFFQELEAQL